MATIALRSTLAIDKKCKRSLCMVMSPPAVGTHSYWEWKCSIAAQDIQCRQHHAWLCLHQLWVLTAIGSGNAAFLHKATDFSSFENTPPKDSSELDIEFVGYCLLGFSRTPSSLD
jgi:hypothetical protein